MKYLLFSSAVIAALVILATEEGANSGKISANLKSVSEKVRTKIVAIVDAPADSNAEAAVKTAEVSIPTPSKEAPENLAAPLTPPASVSSRPVITPETVTVSDNAGSKGEVRPAAPPPSPALPISGDGKRIKSVSAKPVFSVKEEVRLAEGESLMTSKQRRRELNALARDMESMFLDKVVK